MFFVSSQKKSNRMQICKKCEHYRTLTRSCGPLGVGTRLLIEDRIEVELCGCIMPIKTKLKTSTCPLGKWKAMVSSADLREIESLLDSITGNRITGPQNNKLTELWNKASGGNRRVSNCNTCVKDMIKDLKRLTNDK